jgi:hypothetical protein
VQRPDQGLAILRACRSLYGDGPLKVSSRSLAMSGRTLQFWMAAWIGFGEAHIDVAPFTEDIAASVVCPVIATFDVDGLEKYDVIGTTASATARIKPI